MLTLISASVKPLVTELMAYLTLGNTRWWQEEFSAKQFFKSRLWKTTGRQKFSSGINTLHEYLLLRYLSR